MIPKQQRKQYVADIEQFDSALGNMIAALRWSLSRFWADPIAEAAKVNRECGACEMTPEAVWESHGSWITHLLTNYPERMDWFTPPVVAVTFDEAGLIDVDQLATDWQAYLDSLPEPEPEPEEVEP